MRLGCREIVPRGLRLAAFYVAAAHVPDAAGTSPERVGDLPRPDRLETALPHNQQPVIHTMKLIRSVFRGLLAWTIFIFILGAIFALSPHAAEDVLGLLIVGLICGGLASLVRGSRNTPANGTDQHPLADSTPPVLHDVAHQIPGARGARMALALQNTDGPSSEAIAVSYRGETKAYVTRDTWQPVGEFAGLPTDDPEYRLVALMSVYAQNVLCGYGSDYTEQDAIAYALGELVPHEMLEHDILDPSRTATALRLPADVLTPRNLQALRAVINERNSTDPSNHAW